MRLNNVDVSNEYTQGFITKCAEYGITEDMLKEAGLLSGTTTAIGRISPGTAKTLNRVFKFRNPEFLKRFTARLTGRANKMLDARDELKLLDKIRETGQYEPSTFTSKILGKSFTIPAYQVNKVPAATGGFIPDVRRFDRINALIDTEAELLKAMTNIRGRGESMFKARDIYTQPFRSAVSTLFGA